MEQSAPSGKRARNKSKNDQHTNADHVHRADDIFIVSMYTTICWSTQTSNDRQRNTRHLVLVERALASDSASCGERRRQVIDSLPALDQRHRLVLNHEFVLNVTAAARRGNATTGGGGKRPTTATKCDRGSLLRSLTFVGVCQEDPASRAFCEKLRDNEWLRRTVSDVFTLHVSEANLATWSAVYKDFFAHDWQQRRPRVHDVGDDERPDSAAAIYDLPGPPVPVHPAAAAATAAIDAHATRNSCEFIEERISDIIDGLELPDA